MSRFLRQLVQAATLGVVLLGGSLGPVDIAQARETAPQSSELTTVALTRLPAEAQQTHRRILDGGPFPFPSKDGSIFGNRERQLPREIRGYYREYTVPTPQSRDRGARRIVCGGNQPRSPDVCYYTQDHYASFRRIAN
jgi:ribonuclease T1